MSGIHGLRRAAPCFTRGYLRVPLWGKQAAAVRRRQRVGGGVVTGDPRTMPKELPPAMRAVRVEAGHVLYPHLYTWMVFLASMDIILTWVILHFGGSEANRVAATVLERWGLAGMIVLKFASVICVVLISEFVGRRKRGTGRVLVVASIIISLAPVTMGFALLVRFVFGPAAGANFDGLIGN